MVTSGLLSPGKAKVRALLEGKADEEDDIMTEPIGVANDVELKRELVEIGGLAADTKNPEWTKRVKALQRFRGIVAGGAHTLPLFLPLMKECMRDALNLAIQDLRSAVSKEACHAATYMCRTLPPNVWEAMSEWFLASLFKISVVTIAVISQSSSRCLKYILRSGKMSHRAIAVVFDPAHFENKHATYRLTVYQAIFSVLHKMASSEFLPRELDLVLRAVRQGVLDPMPEVRKTARMLYWASYYMLPSKAEALFEKWDAATQKNLLDEKPVYDGLTDAVAVNWETLSRTPAKPSPLSASGHSDGAPTESPHHAKVRSSSAQRRAATPTHGRAVGSQRSSTPVPLRSAEGSNGTPTAARRGISAAARPCTPLSLKKQSLAETSSNGLTPSTTTAASSPAISTHSTSSSVRFKNAKAQSSRASTPSHTDPSGSMEGSGSWNERRKTTTAAAPKKRTASSGRTTTGRGGPAKPLPTSMLSFSALDVDGMDDEDASREGSYEGLSTLEELMAFEDKPLGLRRLGRQIAAGGAGLREVQQKLPTVLRYLTQSMEEGRRNTVGVLCESFRTFGTLAEMLQDTAALEPHFETVLQLVFPRLGAPSTHQNAIGLLEKLLECGHTKVLFPVLLRVLNSPSDKVQLGCLEYLLHMMQFSKDYLGRSGPMEQGISKFLHLSSSPNQDVKQASVTCLGVLCSVGNRSFCAEVLKMTVAEQRKVRVLLLRSHPNLSEDLEAASGSAPSSAAGSRAAQDASFCSEGPTSSTSTPVVTQPKQRTTASPPFSKAGSRDADTPTSPPVNRTRISGSKLSSTTTVRRGSEENNNTNTTTKKRVKKSASVGALSKDQTLGGSMSEKDISMRTSPVRRLQGGTVQRAKTPTVREKEATVPQTLSFKKKRDGGGSFEQNTSIAPLVQTAVSGARGTAERIAAAQKLHHILTAEGSALTASESTLSKYISQLAPLLAQDSLPVQLRITLVDAAAALSVRLNATSATPTLRELFSRILRSYCDADKTLSEHAEEGLHTMVLGGQVACGLQLVVEQIKRMDSQAVHLEEIPLLFRLLEQQITNMGADSPQELMEAVEGFVGLLYTGLGSERADVRKAVVFCFVSIYVAVGSACVPLLKPLATSQLKLITIYVNRRQGQANQVDLASLK